MSIPDRVRDVRRRIEAAVLRSGRSAGLVRLVAVAKLHAAPEIDEALRAGVTDIGENRVQEAHQKQEQLRERAITWHLVGHLQSNKAKLAVQMFDWIHSVDGVDLARRLDRLAGDQGKLQRILLQVDLAGEETKSGLPASELFDALELTGRLPHLRVEGLMVLPPFAPDPEVARPYFARLRELRDEARRRGSAPGSLSELSMGMSHDFEVAIEEGATMVRIGTALFGERPASRPSQRQGSGSLQEEAR